MRSASGTWSVGGAGAGFTTGGSPSGPRFGAGGVNSEGMAGLPVGVVSVWRRGRPGMYRAEFSAGDPGNYRLGIQHLAGFHLLEMTTTNRGTSRVTGINPALLVLFASE